MEVECVQKGKGVAGRLRYCVTTWGLRSLNSCAQIHYEVAAALFMEMILPLRVLPEYSANFGLLMPVSHSPFVLMRNSCTQIFKLFDLSVCAIMSNWCIFGARISFGFWGPNLARRKHRSITQNAEEIVFFVSIVWHKRYLPHEVKKQSRHFTDTVNNFLPCTLQTHTQPYNKAKRRKYTFYHYIYGDNFFSVVPTNISSQAQIE